MTVSIEEDRILYRGHHTLRGVRYGEPRSQGAPQPVTREVFERGEASAILLHNKPAGTLVFVRQFRLPVSMWGGEGYMLEVAAGGMDKDETPLEAALRECREETGYEPAEAVPVCSIHPSPAAVKERLHLYYAEVDDTHRKCEGGGVAHEEEEVATVELPVAEVRDMLDRGLFHDAKTVILLQWFFLTGRASAATGSRPGR